MTQRHLLLPVCLDSGAFSAFRRKQPIEVDSWIEFLRGLRKVYPQVLYVNLDVIPQHGEDTGRESYRNWTRMRKAGLSPMPVYHPTTNISWLKRYLDQTDYIGLGAMARVPDRKRIVFLDRLWRDYLLDKDGKPKVKVHGMGLTSFALMSRYPWHSFDSTSYLQPAVYGKVYVPRRSHGRWDFEHPFQIGVTHGTSWRQRKGLHFDNISPLRQQLVLQYLKTIKLPFGRYRVGDDNKVVEEAEGIATSSRLRVAMNALCFIRYVQSLPQKPYLYLSGGPEIVDFLKQRVPDDNIGVMYSFFDYRTNGGLGRFKRILRTIRS